MEVLKGKAGAEVGVAGGELGSAGSLAAPFGFVFLSLLLGFFYY